MEKTANVFRTSVLAAPHRPRRRLRRTFRPRGCRVGAAAGWHCHTCAARSRPRRSSQRSFASQASIWLPPWSNRASSRSVRTWSLSASFFLPGPMGNPFSGSKLDANDELVPLSGLQSLEKLHFRAHFPSGIHLRDKGLAHRAPLAGLTELRLFGANRNHGYQRLDLSGADVGDHGLDQIAQMTRLTRHALNYRRFRAKSFKNLARLVNLIKLDLIHTRVHDAAPEALAGLTQLQLKAGLHRWRRLGHRFSEVPAARRAAPR
jgi:hypothetical protein